MNNDNEREWLKIGLMTSGGIWFATLIVSLLVILMGNGDAGSHVGDMFNIVNALFSSIAVIGAIYAVVLQQKELAMTREELMGSREAQVDNATTQERIATIQASNSMIPVLDRFIKKQNKSITHFYEVRAEIREMRSNRIIRNSVYYDQLLARLRIINSSITQVQTLDWATIELIMSEALDKKLHHLDTLIVSRNQLIDDLSNSLGIAIRARS